MKINVRAIEIILAETQMTRAALAEKCNISRQNISTILRRGSCEPLTVGKLARGLGVDV